MNTDTLAFTAVCAVDDIVPDTGVAARIQGRQVAVFRLAGASGGSDRFYAIDHVDPRSGAGVLARGLLGNLGERVVVASPLYKNHYDLATGECLEYPELSVTAHQVRVDAGRVLVALG